MELLQQEQRERDLDAAVATVHEVAVEEVGACGRGQAVRAEDVHQIVELPVQVADHRQRRALGYIELDDVAQRLEVLRLATEELRCDLTAENAAAEEDRRDADLKEAEEEKRVKQLTAILAIAILPLPYLGITGAQKAISDAAMLAGDDEGAVRGALRGKDPRSANFQQKRRR